MADENTPQSPRVGPRQTVQPAPQQAAPPPRGMPGVAPPPPLPPNAAQIIAAQQAEVQAQIAEAQRRSQMGQPITGEPQPPVPSPVPGLTAQQVLAGYPQPGQQMQQGQNQFAAYTPPKEVVKDVFRWHPGRNSDIQIELSDCIIAGIPETIVAEPDPQAKIVLALFSEILALRDRLARLEAAGGEAQLPPDLMARLHRVEAATFEQANAMQQRARGVREQIEMLTAQGKSAEEILASLQSQSAAAEAHVAQHGRVGEPSGEPGSGT
jgi:hypothetical protein